jgi:glycosyltransferase involved in cell wall biosynthesis
MIQGPGYVAASARGILGGDFPPWVVSNWGNDLHLFARLADHAPAMREVHQGCDYYMAECRRDIGLARDAGFRGRTLWIGPSAGGFDTRAMRRHWSRERPSRRPWIMIKGYQHHYGRALNALRALELCADSARGYRIGIFKPDPPVELAARVLARKKRLDIVILPPVMPDEHFRRLGQSRISLGVCISDGINTSVLEAMAMGALPIQSDTSCAGEWIEHGRTGLLVDVDDPRDIARALKRAMRDDALVDAAAERNWRTIHARIERSQCRREFRALYSAAARRDPIDDSRWQPCAC